MHGIERHKHVRMKVMIYDVKNNNEDKTWN